MQRDPSRRAARSCSATSTADLAPWLAATLRLHPAQQVGEVATSRARRSRYVERSLDAGLGAGERNLRSPARPAVPRPSRWRRRSRRPRPAATRRGRRSQCGDERRVQRRRRRGDSGSVDGGHHDDRRQIVRCCQATVATSAMNCWASASGNSEVVQTDQHERVARRLAARCRRRDGYRCSSRSCARPGCPPEGRPGSGRSRCSRRAGRAAAHRSPATPPCRCRVQRVRRPGRRR